MEKISTIDHFFKSKFTEDRLTNKRGNRGGGEGGEGEMICS